MLSATSALYAGFVSDGSAGASNYHKARAMTISGRRSPPGQSGFCYRLNLSLGGSHIGSHLRTLGAGGAGRIKPYNTYAVQLNVSGTTVTADD